jgi:hypothetical protein
LDVAVALVNFVAVGLDYPHSLHADLAEAAFGDCGVFVEADLRQRGVRDCSFLAPTPDLGGVNVVEIGAASQLAFFVKSGNARIGRKVNKNARVAVAKSRNQGAAGIFVQAGTEAIYILAPGEPEVIAFEVDGAPQD